MRNTNLSNCQPLVYPASTLHAPGESIRHILVGSPDAIRQTIHRLHSLGYVESLLWSPILVIEDSVTLTSAQGEAMSLVRKPLDGLSF